MANDPISGACDIKPQTQTSTRPRPELEEHFQSEQGMANVSQQGAAAKENIEQKGRDAANRMSATLDEAGRQVKQQAGQAGRRLKDQGQTIVAQQKDRVAEEIEHFGAAAHEAANKLDQENDHNVACYVHMAADQLDGVARYVRESNVNRLVDDMGQMARRRPEVFFGGMFVAGMALARFLKASSRPRYRYEEFDEYSAWDEDLGGFDAEGATVGAGAGTMGTLHEGRQGMLSGDIVGGAGTTPGTTSGLGAGTTPTGTTGIGTSGIAPSSSVGETQPSSFDIPDKRHGDKLGPDAGPSCPPGSAGKEVL